MMHKRSTLSVRISAAYRAEFENESIKRSKVLYGLFEGFSMAIK